MAELNLADLGVIATYFALVLGVAWWASRARKEQSADYFLAGRHTVWFVVGASLFTSNIGSEHLVGLAGSGAAGGLAVGHFEWLASLILLLLGWVFVPFYLRSGVYTMPEFLEQRYNPACRWYFTAISVIGYVLTKISVALYAGGIVIQELTRGLLPEGLGLWASSAVVVALTGVYTVVGGLRAVLYTDTLQAVVLILGMSLLVGVGLHQAGGWSAVEADVPAGYFSMWKPADHPKYPWTGIVLGAPIIGIWYWCTDQYIVQRVLAARNEAEAQSGTIFAGYLKILPVFLFVLPGIIAAALLPGRVADDPNTALPKLILAVLPVGLRGFLLAALLAALMSSLSSIFNSCSTLLTWDIYKQLRPEASERTLILVGRIATGVLVGLGFLWIPFMQYISQELYLYLQSVQGYIAPPIAACFLLGLFIRRLNAPGAFTTLIVGFVIGAGRLVLELINGTVGLPPGSWWQWFAEVNFLHFAAGLFVVSVALLVGVSLLTAPPRPWQVRGLTYQTAEEEPASEGPGEGLPEPGVSRRRLWINIALSALLVLVMAGLWTLFA
jgi:SSS family solute:Na+ symporter